MNKLISIQEDKQQNLEEYFSFLSSQNRKSYVKALKKLEHCTLCKENVGLTIAKNMADKVKFA